jgi:hypothetical protein
MIIAALIAIAMISGCDEEETDDPGDAQLGALDIKHSITVNQVINSLPTDDEPPASDPGMQYARTAIVIANQSSQELIFSPANLSLETEEGDVYSYDYDFTGADVLPSVSTIGPGAELAGIVVFELPISHTPKTLIEDFGGQQIRIDLS